jgi:hypothetical protein
LTPDKVSEYLKTNGGELVTIDAAASTFNRDNKFRSKEKHESLFDEFNDIDE